ncbi:MAG: hypothetical protein CW716_05450 [Candidatus Bathyarchaeum sp.]|nr:MAG: hypothetical protein CW716_05450 [Candidatus Bathyarchaeum sp.]
MYAKKDCVAVFCILVLCSLNLITVYNASAQSTYGSQDTYVSGIVWEDTTWVAQNSTYIITETIQIPENVTLTIEAGTSVTFAGTGYMFLVHGTVYAHGSADNKITIDATGATNVFNTDALSEVFDLEYCIIKNARTLWDITGGLAQVKLRYCVVENITHVSPFSCTKTENYIEYNTFINMAGFSIYDWWPMTGEPPLVHHINHNLIKGNNGVFLQLTINRDTTQVLVHYNTFIDTNETLIELGGSNPQGVNCTENYWGTTNTTVIDSVIHDGHDNINVNDFIEYTPILTEPNPQTPTLPLTANITTLSKTYANMPIIFDGSSSVSEYSNITSYTWDFRDNNITTTSNPTMTHVYLGAATYNVMLTVTDEYGFQNITNKTITVLRDSTAPTTTYEYDGEWHNTDFTIPLSATDNETGVLQTYYRVAMMSVNTILENGQPLINVEGANITLEYWSVDRQNNNEPNQMLTGIKLDKTAPINGIPQHTPQDEVMSDQEVEVSMEVTDTVSGVKNVVLHYSTNNGSTWEDVDMTFKGSNMWSAKIPAQEEGTWVSYKITSYDYAGNSQTTDTSMFTAKYYVVPEFSSAIVLPLLIAVAVAAFITKKRLKQKTTH